MILRDKPGLAELLFATRGSVLPLILPRVLLFALAAAVVTAVDRYAYALPHTDAAPFAVFGIALSLVLGFRNNAAYERWWEARRLWGKMVSDTRSLAREAELFLPDETDRHRIFRLTLAFFHLHRLNLRKQSDYSEVIRWTGEDFAETGHRPCEPLRQMNEIVKASGTDGFGRLALAERIDTLAFGQAANERIATTPLPYVYSLLVFRTTYLYLLLIPLAMLDGAGWLTPLFVAIIAYMLLGLAEVTEELAHPFGDTVNALPLDALCRTMEISLAPHLGVETPAPLTPKDFYLS